MKVLVFVFSIILFAGYASGSSGSSGSSGQVSCSQLHGEVRIAENDVRIAQKNYENEQRQENNPCNPWAQVGTIRTSISLNAVNDRYKRVMQEYYRQCN